MSKCPTPTGTLLWVRRSRPPSIICSTRGNSIRQPRTPSSRPSTCPFWRLSRICKAIATPKSQASLFPTTMWRTSGASSWTRSKLRTTSSRSPVTCATWWPGAPTTILWSRCLPGRRAGRGLLEAEAIVGFEVWFMIN